MSTRLERLRDMRAWIDSEIAHEVEHMASTGADWILARACALYGVEVSDVLAGGRKQQEVRARQAAAWLLRRCNLSFPHIGSILGCDHTTALYACRKIDASPSVRALLLGLEAAA